MAKKKKEKRFIIFEIQPEDVHCGDCEYSVHGDGYCDLFDRELNIDYDYKPKVCTLCGQEIAANAIFRCDECIENEVEVK